MHFPARKTIDTYLSRNHVVVHTFSSVRESITFIKSKGKSSFYKGEISISGLVESREQPTRIYGIVLAERQ